MVYVGVKKVAVVYVGVEQEVIYAGLEVVADLID